MKSSNAATQDERIARMTVAAVYPHYVAKVERKGRSREELDTVISWLTGYSPGELQKHIAAGSTFATFFAGASLNPLARLITGNICGHCVEKIENPLTQNVRRLDKLVDELAKGRTMERILRKE